MSGAPGGWPIMFVICRRELVRFARQPARIAAAIGTPLLLWLFLSSGFTGAVRSETLGSASYAAFILPGAMTLIAVFTAIFSSISIIEDRQQGWLQGVLVAPAPRWSIAMGKILGGSIVAWMQAAGFLLFVPFLDLELTWPGTLLTLLSLALTCLAMTGLGVAFAWRSETTAGFHAVMNLVFMPMWLLSGAFFSVRGAAPWLAWMMWINPLTWCNAAIRGSMLGEFNWPALLVAAAFAGAMIVLATVIVSRPTA